MTRTVRVSAVSGVFMAAVIAAAATSSTSFAAKRIYTPEQREANRLRAQAHPETVWPQCTHYPGGATKKVSCAMSDQGGPVISSVNAVPVFWSYGGVTIDSNITAWAPPYIAALVDSPFMDQLSEYSISGQSITRGTTTKAYTITPTSANDKATVTDAMIVSQLAASVKAGDLPAVTTDSAGQPKTLYVIFFAPGITINGAGGTSCTDFCGYHSSGTSGSTTYIYAVIPDLSVVQTYALPDGGSVTEPCGYGCATNAPLKPEVEWFNGTVSHEISEAVTDPEVSSNSIGWYDQSNTDFACGGSQSQNQPGGGEIGDVCVGFWDDEYGSAECEDTAEVPGTNDFAQQIWSNAQTGCYVANTSVTPKCPSAGCVDGGAGPINPPGPAADGGSSSDAGSKDDGGSGSGSGSSSGSSSGGGADDGGSGSGSGSSSGSGSGSGSGGGSGSSSGGGSGSGSGSSGGGNEDASLPTDASAGSSGGSSGSGGGGGGCSVGHVATTGGTLPFAFGLGFVAFGAYARRRRARPSATR